MTVLAHARLWLFLQQEWLGLAAGGMVAMLITACLATFLIPAGPGETVHGTVTGFGMRERDGGSYRVMAVQTSDRLVTVRVSIARGCEIGDAVTIRRLPHWWGTSHRLPLGDPHPCQKQSG